MQKFENMAKPTIFIRIMTSLEMKIKNFYLHSNDPVIFSYILRIFAAFFLFESVMIFIKLCFLNYVPNIPQYFDKIEPGPLLAMMAPKFLFVSLTLT